MNFLVTVFFAITLLGCGASHQGGKTSGQNTPASSAADSTCSATPVAPLDTKLAFNQSLRPALRTACATCHGDSANAPSLFAHSDATRAYDAAVKHVDLGTPGNSYFVRRMNDGHNCGGSASCDEKKALFETEIAHWVSLMSPPPVCVAKTTTDNITPGTSPSPTPSATPTTTNIFRTKEYAIPTTLSKTVDTTVRLELDDPSVNYGQVLFEVKLQRVDDATSASPGSYRVRFPKLATATQSLKISKVAIRINDESTTYNNFFYLIVDQIVAAAPFTASAATLAFPVLSNSEQLIPMETVQDKLRFTFTLAPTTATQPPPQPTPTTRPTPAQESTFFVQNVKPIISSRCAGCHQNGTPYRTPLNDDVLLRTNTVARIDRVTPSNSLLIRKGTGAVSHGGGNALDANQVAVITQWIQMVQ